MATGGLIDRSQVLRFSFAGKLYQGHPGDTLASALVANGVRLLGRSFKFHRPRGLLAAGAEEPNALVQLGTGARSTPNVRATEVMLYDGLVARPVNCWPSLAVDVGAINGRFARFLASGFYYKTFMWPSWHVYEGLIRRAAGLGRPSTEPDPDRYDHRFAHCDVLVVGSGPAGLAAARAAAGTGKRVILAEQDFSLGGSLLYRNAAIDGRPASDWVAEVEAELNAAPDVRVLTRTTGVGYFDHNALALVECVSDEERCAEDPVTTRYRLWQVRAGEVVLATGAIERPLVFPGNDRPGVMLASAAWAYAARWAARAGRKAVIFTNNDDAYGAAEALADAGVDISAIVDARPKPPEDLHRRWRAAGVEIVPGGVVTHTRGRKSVTAAKVQSADGSARWIACDLVAMSGGASPTVHLFSQSGGALRFDEEIAAFVPDRSVQREISVGAAAGAFDLAIALAQGHRAGGGGGDPPGAHVSRQRAPLAPLWHVESKGKAFVDFQNDVTADDIALAARENYRSVEHLKRYTTLGMAPDQGKTANVNALAIMSALTGRSIAESGTTRFRFPYTPIPIGVMAGRQRKELFRPLRIMPGHERHFQARAVFHDFGGWLRPAYYLGAGEDAEAAARREALAVRTAAGLFEGSPLGKIEIVGPDAAMFLDRIYANTMSTLKPGRVRYGLMLNELGVIIDDGVAARIADDHFLVCTSSGGAARIAAWIEEWLQCEWTGLDVVAAPVTTAWGVLTLTGPSARVVLERVGSDIDLSREAFPHMSFRQGTVAGHRARILRVSYTGELSYEVNVPTDAVPQIWERILDAGRDDGVLPVGVDAWDLLRTEKGYLHIGADTDGTTTPLDVGWAQVLRKKSDFVGKRSLTLPDNRRPDRLGFVGFEVLDAGGALPIGSHLVAAAGSDGYVTSSGVSAVLGRPVALGMVRGGDARMGEEVAVQSPGGMRRARIVPPAAFDPEGARLDA